MATAAAAAVRFDLAVHDTMIGAQNLAHLERVSRNSTAAMLASFNRLPEPKPAFGRLLAVASHD
jgi:hypothetical protein